MMQQQLLVTLLILLQLFESYGILIESTEDDNPSRSADYYPFNEQRMLYQGTSAHYPRVADVTEMSGELPFGAKLQQQPIDTDYSSVIKIPRAAKLKRCKDNRFGSYRSPYKKRWDEKLSTSTKPSELPALSSSKPEQSTDNSLYTLNKPFESKQLDVDFSNEDYVIPAAAASHEAKDDNFDIKWHKPLLSYLHHTAETSHDSWENWSSEEEKEERQMMTINGGNKQQQTDPISLLLNMKKRPQLSKTIVLPEPVAETETYEIPVLRDLKQEPKTYDFKIENEAPKVHVEHTVTEKLPSELGGNHKFQRQGYSAGIPLVTFKPPLVFQKYNTNHKQETGTTNKNLYLSSGSFNRGISDYRKMNIQKERETLRAQKNNVATKFHNPLLQINHNYINTPLIRNDEMKRKFLDLNTPGLVKQDSQPLKFNLPQPSYGIKATQNKKPGYQAVLNLNDVAKQNLKDMSRQKLAPYLVTTSSGNSIIRPIQPNALKPNHFNRAPKQLNAVHNLQELTSKHNDLSFSSALSSKFHSFRVNTTPSFNDAPTDSSLKITYTDRNFDRNSDSKMIKSSINNEASAVEPKYNTTLKIAIEPSNVYLDQSIKEDLLTEESKFKVKSMEYDSLISDNNETVALSEKHFQNETVITFETNSVMQKNLTGYRKGKVIESQAITLPVEVTETTGLQRNEDVMGSDLISQMNKNISVNVKEAFNEVPKSDETTASKLKKILNKNSFHSKLNIMQNEINSTSVEEFIGAMFESQKMRHSHSISKEAFQQDISQHSSILPNTLSSNTEKIFSVPNEASKNLKKETSLVKNQTNTKSQIYFGSMANYTNTPVFEAPASEAVHKDGSESTLQAIDATKMIGIQLKDSSKETSNNLQISAYETHDLITSPTAKIEESTQHGLGQLKHSDMLQQMHSLSAYVGTNHTPKYTDNEKIRKGKYTPIHISNELGNELANIKPNTENIKVLEKDNTVNVPSLTRTILRLTELLHRHLSETSDSASDSNENASHNVSTSVKDNKSAVSVNDEFVGNKGHKSSTAEFHRSVTSSGFFENVTSTQTNVNIANEHHISPLFQKNFSRGANQQWNHSSINFTTEISSANENDNSSKCHSLELQDMVLTNEAITKKKEGFTETAEPLTNKPSSNKKECLSTNQEIYKMSTGEGQHAIKGKLLDVIGKAVTSKYSEKKGRELDLTVSNNPTVSSHYSLPVTTFLELKSLGTKEQGLSHKEFPVHKQYLHSTLINKDTVKLSMNLNTIAKDTTFTTQLENQNALGTHSQPSIKQYDSEHKMESNAFSTLSAYTENIEHRTDLSTNDFQPSMSSRKLIEKDENTVAKQPLLHEKVIILEDSSEKESREKLMNIHDKAEEELNKSVNTYHSAAKNVSHTWKTEINDTFVQKEHMGTEHKEREKNLENLDFLLAKGMKESTTTGKIYKNSEINNKNRTDDFALLENHFSEINLTESSHTKSKDIVVKLLAQQHDNTLIPLTPKQQYSSLIDTHSLKAAESEVNLTTFKFNTMDPESQNISAAKALKKKSGKKLTFDKTPIIIRIPLLLNGDASMTENTSLFSSFSQGADKLDVRDPTYAQPTVLPQKIVTNQNAKTRTVVPDIHSNSVEQKQEPNYHIVTLLQHNAAKDAIPSLTETKTYPESLNIGVYGTSLLKETTEPSNYCGNYYSEKSLESDMKALETSNLQQILKTKKKIFSKWPVINESNNINNKLATTELNTSSWKQQKTLEDKEVIPSAFKTAKYNKTNIEMEHLNTQTTYPDKLKDKEAIVENNTKLVFISNGHNKEITLAREFQEVATQNVSAIKNISVSQTESQVSVTDMNDKQTTGVKKGKNLDLPHEIVPLSKPQPASEMDIDIFRQDKMHNSQNEDSEFIIASGKSKHFSTKDPKSKVPSASSEGKVVFENNLRSKPNASTSQYVFSNNENDIKAPYSEHDLNKNWTYKEGSFQTTLFNNTSLKTKDSKGPKSLIPSSKEGMNESRDSFLVEDQHMYKTSVAESALPKSHASLMPNINEARFMQKARKGKHFQMNHENNHTQWKSLVPPANALTSIKDFHDIFAYITIPPKSKEPVQQLKNTGDINYEHISIDKGHKSLASTANSLEVRDNYIASQSSTTHFHSSSKEMLKSKNFVASNSEIEFPTSTSLLASEESFLNEFGIKDSITFDTRMSEISTNAGTAQTVSNINKVEEQPMIWQSPVTVTSKKNSPRLLNLISSDRTVNNLQNKEETMVLMPLAHLRQLVKEGVSKAGTQTVIENSKHEQTMQNKILDDYDSTAEKDSKHLVARNDAKKQKNMKKLYSELIYNRSAHADSHETTKDETIAIQHYRNKHGHKGDGTTISELNFQNKQQMPLTVKSSDATDEENEGIISSENVSITTTDIVEHKMLDIYDKDGDTINENNFIKEHFTYSRTPGDYVGHNAGKAVQLSDSTEGVKEFTTHSMNTPKDIVYTSTEHILGHTIVPYRCSGSTYLEDCFTKLTEKKRPYVKHIYGVSKEEIPQTNTSPITSLTNTVSLDDQRSKEVQTTDVTDVSNDYLVKKSLKFAVQTKDEPRTPTKTNDLKYVNNKNHTSTTSSQIAVWNCEDERIYDNDVTKYFTRSENSATYSDEEMESNDNSKVILTFPGPSTTSVPDYLCDYAESNIVHSTVPYSKKDGSSVMETSLLHDHMSFAVNANEEDNTLTETAPGTSMIGDDFNVSEGFIPTETTNQFTLKNNSELSTSLNYYSQTEDQQQRAEQVDYLVENNEHYTFTTHNLHATKTYNNKDQRITLLHEDNNYTFNDNPSTNYYGRSEDDVEEKKESTDSDKITSPEISDTNRLYSREHSSISYSKNERISETDGITSPLEPYASYMRGYTSEEEIPETKVLSLKKLKVNDGELTPVRGMVAAIETKSGCSTASFNILQSEEQEEIATQSIYLQDVNNENTSNTKSLPTMRALNLDSKEMLYMNNDISGNKPKIKISRAPKNYHVYTINHNMEPQDGSKTLGPTEYQFTKKFPYMSSINYKNTQDVPLTHNVLTVPSTVHQADNNAEEFTAQTISTEYENNDPSILKELRLSASWLNQSPKTQQLNHISNANNEASLTIDNLLTTAAGIHPYNENKWAIEHSTDSTYLTTPAEQESSYKTSSFSVSNKNIEITTMPSMNSVSSNGNRKPKMEDINAVLVDKEASSAKVNGNFSLLYNYLLDFKRKHPTEHKTDLPDVSKEVISISDSVPATTTETYTHHESEMMTAAYTDYSEDNKALKRYDFYGSDESFESTKNSKLATISSRSSKVTVPNQSHNNVVINTEYTSVTQPMNGNVLVTDYIESSRSLSAQESNKNVNEQHTVNIGTTLSAKIHNVSEYNEGVLTTNVVNANGGGCSVKADSKLLTSLVCNIQSEERLQTTEQSNYQMDKNYKHSASQGTVYPTTMGFYQNYESQRKELQHFTADNIATKTISPIPSDGTSQELNSEYTTMSYSDNGDPSITDNFIPTEKQFTPVNDVSYEEFPFIPTVPSIPLSLDEVDGSAEKLMTTKTIKVVYGKKNERSKKKDSIFSADFMNQTEEQQLGMLQFNYTLNTNNGDTNATKTLPVTTTAAGIYDENHEASQGCMGDDNHETECSRRQTESVVYHTEETANDCRTIDLPVTNAIPDKDNMYDNTAVITEHTTTSLADQTSSHYKTDYLTTPKPYSNMKNSGNEDGVLPNENKLGLIADVIRINTQELKTMHPTEPLSGFSENKDSGIAVNWFRKIVGDETETVKMFKTGFSRKAKNYVYRRGEQEETQGSSNIIKDLITHQPAAININHLNYGIEASEGHTIGTNANAEETSVTNPATVSEEVSATATTFTTKSTEAVIFYKETQEAPKTITSLTTEPTEKVAFEDILDEANENVSISVISFTAKPTDEVILYETTKEVPITVASGTTKLIEEVTFDEANDVSKTLRSFTTNPIEATFAETSKEFPITASSFSTIPTEGVTFEASEVPVTVTSFTATPIEANIFDELSEVPKTVTSSATEETSVDAANDEVPTTEATFFINPMDEITFDEVNEELPVTVTSFTTTPSEVVFYESNEGFPKTETSFTIRTTDVITFAEASGDAPTTVTSFIAKPTTVIVDERSEEVPITTTSFSTKSPEEVPTVFTTKQTKEDTFKKASEEVIKTLTSFSMNPTEATFIETTSIPTEVVTFNPASEKIPVTTTIFTTNIAEEVPFEEPREVSASVTSFTTMPTEEVMFDAASEEIPKTVSSFTTKHQEDITFYEASKEATITTFTIKPTAEVTFDKASEELPITVTSFTTQATEEVDFDNASEKLPITVTSFTTKPTAATFYKASGDIPRSVPSFTTKLAEVVFDEEVSKTVTSFTTKPTEEAIFDDSGEEVPNSITLFTTKATEEITFDEAMKEVPVTSFITKSPEVIFDEAGEKVPITVMSLTTKQTKEGTFEARKVPKTLPTFTMNPTAVTFTETSKDFPITAPSFSTIPTAEVTFDKTSEELPIIVTSFNTQATEEDFNNASEEVPKTIIPFTTKPTDVTFYEASEEVPRSRSSFTIKLTEVVFDEVPTTASSFTTKPIVEAIFDDSGEEVPKIITSFAIKATEKTTIDEAIKEVPISSFITKSPEVIFDKAGEKVPLTVTSFTSKPTKQGTFDVAREEVPKTLTSFTMNPTAVTYTEKSKEFSIIAPSFSTIPTEEVIFYEASEDDPISVTQLITKPTEEVTFGDIITTENMNIVHAKKQYPAMKGNLKISAVEKYIYNEEYQQTTEQPSTDMHPLYYEANTNKDPSNNAYTSIKDFSMTTNDIGVKDFLVAITSPVETSTEVFQQTTEQPSLNPHIIGDHAFMTENLPHITKELHNYEESENTVKYNEIFIEHTPPRKRLRMPKSYAAYSANETIAFYDGSTIEPDLPTSAMLFNNYGDSAGFNMSTRANKNDNSVTSGAETPTSIPCVYMSTSINEDTISTITTSLPVVTSTVDDDNCGQQEITQTMGTDYTNVEVFSPKESPTSKKLLYVDMQSNEKPKIKANSIYSADSNDISSFRKDVPETTAGLYDNSEKEQNMTFNASDTQDNIVTAYPSLPDSYGADQKGGSFDILGTTANYMTSFGESDMDSNHNNIKQDTENDDMVQANKEKTIIAGYVTEVSSHSMDIRNTNNENDEYLTVTATAPTMGSVYTEGQVVIATEGMLNAYSSLKSSRSFELDNNLQNNKHHYITTQPGLNGLTTEYPSVTEETNTQDINIDGEQMTRVYSLNNDSVKRDFLETDYTSTTINDAACSVYEKDEFYNANNIPTDSTITASTFDPDDAELTVQSFSADTSTKVDDIKTYNHTAYIISTNSLSEETIPPDMAIPTMSSVRMEAREYDKEEWRTQSMGVLHENELPQVREKSTFPTLHDDLQTTPQPPGLIDNKNKSDCTTEQPSATPVDFKNHNKDVTGTESHLELYSVTEDEITSKYSRMAETTNTYNTDNKPWSFESTEVASDFITSSAYTDSEYLNEKLKVSAEHNTKTYFTDKDPLTEDFIREAGYVTSTDVNSKNDLSDATVPTISSKTNALYTNDVTLESLNIAEPRAHKDHISEKKNKDKYLLPENSLLPEKQQQTTAHPLHLMNIDEDNSSTNGEYLSTTEAAELYYSERSEILKKQNSDNFFTDAIIVAKNNRVPKKYTGYDMNLKRKLHNGISAGLDESFRVKGTGSAYKEESNDVYMTLTNNDASSSMTEYPKNSNTKQYFNLEEVKDMSKLDSMSTTTMAIITKSNDFDSDKGMKKIQVSNLMHTVETASTWENSKLSTDVSHIETEDSYYVTDINDNESSMVPSSYTTATQETHESLHDKQSSDVTEDNYFSDFFKRQVCGNDKMESRGSYEMTTDSSAPLAVTVIHNLVNDLDTNKEDAMKAYKQNVNPLMISKSTAFFTADVSDYGDTRSASSPSEVYRNYKNQDSTHINKASEVTDVYHLYDDTEMSTESTILHNSDTNDLSMTEYFTTAATLSTYMSGSISVNEETASITTLAGDDEELRENRVNSVTKDHLSTTADIFYNQDYQTTPTPFVTSNSIITTDIRAMYSRAQKSSSTAGPMGDGGTSLVDYLTPTGFVDHIGNTVDEDQAENGAESTKTSALNNDQEDEFIAVEFTDSTVTHTRSSAISNNVETSTLLDDTIHTKENPLITTLLNSPLYVTTENPITKRLPTIVNSYDGTDNRRKLYNKQRNVTEDKFAASHSKMTISDHLFSRDDVSYRNNKAISILDYITSLNPTDIYQDENTVDATQHHVNSEEKFKFSQNTILEHDDIHNKSKGINLLGIDKIQSTKQVPVTEHMAVSIVNETDYLNDYSVETSTDTKRNDNSALKNERNKPVILMKINNTAGGRGIFTAEHSTSFYDTQEKQSESDIKGSTNEDYTNNDRGLISSEDGKLTNMILNNSNYLNYSIPVINSKQLNNNGDGLGQETTKKIHRFHSKDILLKPKKKQETNKMLNTSYNSDAIHKYLLNNNRKSKSINTSLIDEYKSIKSMLSEETELGKDEIFNKQLESRENKFIPSLESNTSKTTIPRTENEILIESKHLNHFSANQPLTNTRSGQKNMYTHIERYVGENLKNKRVHENSLHQQTTYFDTSEQQMKNSDSNEVLNFSAQSPSQNVLDEQFYQNNAKILPKSLTLNIINSKSPKAEHQRIKPSNRQENKAVTRKVVGQEKKPIIKDVNEVVSKKERKGEMLHAFYSDLRESLTGERDLSSYRISKASKTWDSGGDLIQTHKRLLSKASTEEPAAAITNETSADDSNIKLSSECKRLLKKLSKDQYPKFMNLLGKMFKNETENKLPGHSENLHWNGNAKSTQGVDTNKTELEKPEHELLHLRTLGEKTNKIKIPENQLKMNKMLHKQFIADTLSLEYAAESSLESPEALAYSQNSETVYDDYDFLGSTHKKSSFDSAEKLVEDNTSAKHLFTNYKPIKQFSFGKTTEDKHSSEKSSWVPTESLENKEFFDSFQKKQTAEFAHSNENYPDSYEKGVLNINHREEIENGKMLSEVRASAQKFYGNKVKHYYSNPQRTSNNHLKEVQGDKDKPIIYVGDLYFTEPTPSQAKKPTSGKLLLWNPKFPAPVVIEPPENVFSYENLRVENSDGIVSNKHMYGRNNGINLQDSANAVNEKHKYMTENFNTRTNRNDNDHASESIVNDGRRPRSKHKIFKYVDEQGMQGLLQDKNSKYSEYKHHRSSNGKAISDVSEEIQGKNPYGMNSKGMFKTSNSENSIPHHITKPSTHILQRKIRSTLHPVTKHDNNFYTTPSMEMTNLHKEFAQTAQIAKNNQNFSDDSKSKYNENMSGYLQYTPDAAKSIFLKLYNKTNTINKLSDDQKYSTSVNKRKHSLDNYHDARVKQNVNKNTFCSLCGTTRQKNKNYNKENNNNLEVKNLWKRNNEYTFDFYSTEEQFMVDYDNTHPSRATRPSRRGKVLEVSQKLYTPLNNIKSQSRYHQKDTDNAHPYVINVNQPTINKGEQKFSRNKIKFNGHNSEENVYDTSESDTFDYHLSGKVLHRVDERHSPYLQGKWNNIVTQTEKQKLPHVRNKIPNDVSLPDARSIIRPRKHSAESDKTEYEYLIQDSIGHPPVYKNIMHLLQKQKLQEFSKTPYDSQEHELLLSMENTGVRDYPYDNVLVKRIQKALQLEKPRAKESSEQENDKMFRKGASREQGFFQPKLDLLKTFIKWLRDLVLQQ